MKKILLTLLAALALGTVSFAQNGTGQQVYVASHLTWSEAGPDLPTVSGYSYQYFADGATTGTALTGVTCSGTASPFTCSVSMPAFTPGAHALTLVASDIAGASQPSSAISFTFVVAPSTPTALAIK